MSLRDMRKSRRVTVDLDMTPLIDVVFLLLIFFLVTSTFSKTEDAEIPINLPSAASGEAISDAQKIVLFITEDGSVEIKSDAADPGNVLDGEQIEGANLSEKLANLYAKHPDANVLLRGDKLATHGKVIEILDQIKESGFKSVNLVITQPASK
ncbi:ExbD/TolR family protein [Bradymonas sediminis]|uniref:Uncharacterized protein n=1 Tax=Bradymonas sediminis TaxID=1548548 RepID=A0A2Z4FHB8_9DELT|nr:biopolymer transporter ExbD [Bradymonas sediminis]AWV88046.1 hypothetical protein DN745_01335 [Bradymonas sediminis]TDP77169.1 biopolymer transport protein ExbD [Bradymonas sediminis]